MATITVTLGEFQGQAAARSSREVIAGLVDASYDLGQDLYMFKHDGARYRLYLRQVGRNFHLLLDREINGENNGT